MTAGGRRMTHFLRSLECLKKQTALPNVWDSLLSEEYQCVESYFRSTGRRSQWYPSFDANGQLCRFRVDPHIPGEYIGKCEKTGEVILLTEAQVVFLEVDLARLQKDIAAALGIDYLDPPDTLSKYTCRLGTIVSSDRRRHPAFFSITPRPNILWHEAKRLVLANDGPFVMLPPTYQNCRPQIEAFLRRKRLQLWALCDVLVLGDDGQWHATPAATKRLKALGVRKSSKSNASRPSPNVLKRRGSGWEVSFQGKTEPLPNLKGFAYIALLLAHPRQALPVVTVWAQVNGQDARLGQGSLGTILDPEAIAEYRRQRDELKQEVVQAKADGDFGRQEMAQSAIAIIEEHVRAAAGFGGRNRTSSDADHIRCSVKMAIEYAHRCLDEHHPALARHLLASLDTGFTLIYHAEPPVEWDV